MFKVGDTVRVLFNNPRGSYFKKGDTFVVEEILDERIFGKLKNRESNYVFYKDIELITKTHMPNWF